MMMMLMMGTDGDDDGANIYDDSCSSEFAGLRWRTWRWWRQRWRRRKRGWLMIVFLLSLIIGMLVAGFLALGCLCVHGVQCVVCFVYFPCSVQWRQHGSSNGRTLIGLESYMDLSICLSCDEGTPVVGRSTVLLREAAVSRQSLERLASYSWPCCACCWIHYLFYMKYCKRYSHPAVSRNQRWVWTACWRRNRFGRGLGRLWGCSGEALGRLRSLLGGCSWRLFRWGLVVSSWKLLGAF